ncbi:MAG: type II toxin-antitoxin system Phd/YefM family antitoxin [Gemmatimonadota bacterium]
MEHKISATELARRLGDVLGRVRYRGDSFLVERNGEAVARVVPLPEGSVTTVREALAAWGEAGKPDPAFASDLERVGAADRPPEDAWDSSSTRARSSR